MTHAASRPLQGALVSVRGSVQSAIAFQYNPSTVRRTLQPQVYGAEPGARSELVMLTGAPVETISFELTLDATDGQQVNQALNTTGNVGAQLAALELLAYPPLSAVRTNDALLASGVLEVAPFVAPLTVLVLGPSRVVPVAIQGLVIEELLHDPFLNPLHARVSINLRVLSYSDLASNQAGYEIFASYQQSRETAAGPARINGASIYGVVGVDPSSWGAQ